MVPKPRFLDLVGERIRSKHYSTHVLKQGGKGVVSPLEEL